MQIKAITESIDCVVLLLDRSR